VSTPVDGSPISENGVYDMSTTRPGLSASRSSTRHVVLAPVTSFVTVSSVPRGSHGLAQPPAGVSVYHVAPPVADAAGAVVVVGGGGGGAVVVVVVVVVGGGAVVAVAGTAAPVAVDDAADAPVVDVAAIRWSLK
jgi:hypothetical protein